MCCRLGRIKSWTEIPHGLRNEISSGKIGEKDLRCIVPLKEAEMTALSLKKSMQSVAPFDPFEESQKM
jgi:hypothetical protein